MCVCVCARRIETGKQTKLRPHFALQRRQRSLLMISTASSTAEMVTQGKLEISAVDNVEGKYVPWSLEERGKSHALLEPCSGAREWGETVRGQSFRVNMLGHDKHY